MNSTTSRLKEGFVLRCPVEDDLLPKSQIMGSEDHTVFIKVCFHFYLYCMVFYSTILVSNQIIVFRKTCLLLPHGQNHYRLITHDLIPNCLLLHLEAGRILETFIASTFGYKPSSSTDTNNRKTAIRTKLKSLSLFS